VSLSPTRFYWIALADTTDSAHKRAIQLAAELRISAIVTTDEVLAEFLTFVATAPEPMRRKAVLNAHRILEASQSAWSRRAGSRFSPFRAGGFRTSFRET